MEDIEQTINEQYKTNPEHAAHNVKTIPAMGEKTTVTLNMSPVVFYGDAVENAELRHTYWFRNKQLQGVTSTLIKKAFPDMYKGISKDTLQNAADRGNSIHDQVQQNLLFGGDAYTAEEVNANKIVDENDLTILDTEYLVSDEKNFASAIDLVAQDADGDVILIDIKTTSERHYDAVSLQLSIYSEWFEKQNPTLKVKGLWLMWLRGGEYRFEQVPRVDRRKIKLLEKAYLRGIEYEYEDVPKWLNQRSKDMARLMKIIEEAQNKLDALKDTTLSQMSDEHWYSLKKNGVTISKVAASQSPRFNSTQLKKDDPEMYQKYLSMTQKKEYLTIKMVRG